jgi:hypothetical protein
MSTLAARPAPQPVPGPEAVPEEPVDRQDKVRCWSAEGISGILFYRVPRRARRGGRSLKLRLC